VAGKAAIDGDAEETLLDAEVFIAVLAVAALAAADPGEYRAPGADQIFRNVGTDFLDYTGDLVAPPRSA
jgi:hypothetical protein